MVGMSKLRAAFGGVTGLVALAVTGWPGDAGQASVPPLPKGEYVAVYDVFFGGFQAGEITVASRIGPETYTAEVDFQTRGVVGYFFDQGYKARITGEVTPDGLAPKHFTAEDRDEEKVRTIEISYSGETPQTVKVDPPYSAKPWSIEPGAQAGAADPVTGAMAAFGPAPEGQVCDRSSITFDGRYRYALEVGPAQPDGELLKCRAEYVRLAGYKPKWAGDKARSPFMLYFRKNGDGLYQAVRATAETDFGTSVFQLRE